MSLIISLCLSVDKVGSTLLHPLICAKVPESISEPKLEAKVSGIQLYLVSCFNAKLFCLSYLDFESGVSRWCTVQLLLCLHGQEFSKVAIKIIATPPCCSPHTAGFQCQMKQSIEPGCSLQCVLHSSSSRRNTALSVQTVPVLFHRSKNQNPKPSATYLYGLELVSGGVVPGLLYGLICVFTAQTETCHRVLTQIFCRFLTTCLLRNLSAAADSSIFLPCPRSVATVKLAIYASTVSLGRVSAFAIFFCDLFHVFERQRCLLLTLCTILPRLSFNMQSKVIVNKPRVSIWSTLDATNEALE